MTMPDPPPLDALQSALPSTTRYSVKKPLGSGAFAHVYLVRNEDLGRDEAIKIPAREECLPARLEEFSQQFKDEGRKLSALDDLGIVKVHYVGELSETPYWPAGWPFAALEYAPGGSLDEYRRQQPNERLAPEDAARLVSEVAAAMAYAHGRGLFHRDLKPANIFLKEGGQACIGDWGLAVDWRYLRPLSSGFVGTYAYASPEQVCGDRVDGRSDIWALGVVLYELLTGRLPFSGELEEMLADIAQAEYAPMRQTNPGMPVELERICQRCLRAAPDERYSTAHDLADRLRNWNDAQQRSKIRPFCLIERARLFGSPGNLRDFAPTEEEFRGGRVHRSAVTDQVEQRLSNDDWVLVRGLGAAGKTVLALQIAMHPQSRFVGFLVYYLNLQDMDKEVDDAPDAIPTLAREDVLFVVDNVHINEDLAEKIYRRWEEKRSGSRLLMLGRFVAGVRDERGVRRPMEFLAKDALRLKVCGDDLAGVFRRLASRWSSSGMAIPEPPDTVLRSWCKVFGGDLIAFSAAVGERMRDLLASQWQLKAGDAGEYIKKTYLKGISREELESLLRLAALAEIELSATPKAVHDIHLERYIRTGLVLGILRSNQQDLSYKLIHPGFAELIWSAAGDTREHAALRLDIARDDTELAIRMVFRLDEFDSDEEVASVLREVISRRDEVLRSLLAHGLSYTMDFFLLASRYNVMSDSECNRLLCQYHDRLLDMVCHSEFADLVAYLYYTRARLPSVHSALAEALIAAAGSDQLLDWICGADLITLTGFLKHARTELRPVHAALAKYLSAEVNHNRLLDLACRSDLASLGGFLFYARRYAPPVHSALAKVLNTEANRNHIFDLARCSHLADLGEFLDYARTELRPVHAALAKDLSVEANHNRLLDLVCRSDLNALADAFDCVRNYIPQVFSAMAEALIAEANRNRLLAMVYRSSVAFLTSFLRYARIEVPSVHSALAEALIAAAGSDRFLDWICDADLEELIEFLDDPRKEIPHFHSTLAKALSAEANRDRLLDLACSSNLANLTTFLRYVRTKMPSVHTALAETLGSEANRGRLVDQIVSTDVEDWIQFLEYTHEYMRPCYATCVEILSEEVNRERFNDAIGRAGLDRLIECVDHLGDSGRSRPEEQ